MRETIGRPRLEIDQPELLKAIVNIAMSGAATHEKRREDIYRSIQTLTELNESLENDLDFRISRSATYYRLLPKRSNGVDGKRHVNTVPVRLGRARNDFHKEHIDTSFAKTSIRHLEELASYLGPDMVALVSQDDPPPIANPNAC